MATDDIHKQFKKAGGLALSALTLTALGFSSAAQERASVQPFQLERTTETCNTCPYFTAAMFMKLEGIKGGAKPEEDESRDHAYKDAMAWSWGISQAGSFHSGGGEDRLTENVTMNFAKVTWNYQPQKNDGSKDSGTVDRT